MKEKWVRINTIEGYENVRDCYWIGNIDEDKIMNRSTGKQMKIGINDGGYKIARLMTNQGRIRHYRVHVLKAKAFLFGPYILGANVVRHLNDIKTDNRLENLAFGTMSDNTKDCIRNGNFNYKAAVKGLIKGRAKGNAISAKKRSKPVRCIETGIIYASMSEANRQTGISYGSISNCCRGKRKTAGGYHWEYVD